MFRQASLLEGIYTALEGDESRPAAAIRAALLVHTIQPALVDGPQSDCATCVGTGTGLVDGRWVHCCCGCALCTCGEAICDEGCETVETLADALGVVVAGV